MKEICCHEYHRVHNEDENGDEIEVEVICSECRGHGKHSRAIDGNGITSSEWAEWDDDNYLGQMVRSISN